jgi:hypothetical protein
MTVERTLFAVKPYRRGVNDLWVLDHPLDGPLPFAPPGMQGIIDRATVHLPNAEDGFLAVFSDRRFDGAQVVLQRLRAEGAGYWYRWTETGQTGWFGSEFDGLFSAPPKRIFLRLCDPADLHRKRGGIVDKHFTFGALLKIPNADRDVWHVVRCAANCATASARSEASDQ